MAKTKRMIDQSLYKPLPPGYADEHFKPRLRACGKTGVWSGRLKLPRLLGISAQNAGQPKLSETGFRPRFQSAARAFARSVERKPEAGKTLHMVV